MSALRRRHPPPGGSADAQEESAAAPAPPAAPVHRSSEDLTNQRLAAVFLAIIAAAIYANTLNADFCYDDNFAIVNNKDVTGANPISAMWTHDFWGQNITKIDSHKSYRPFTVLSFRLNHYLAGLAPMSYHAVNMVLHSVVTVLAFNLYLRISAAPATLQMGINPEFIIAFIAALLFALHPVHVEAVAGVVGRAELLCAIMYIAAIVLYKHAVTLTHTRWRLFPLIALCYVSATLAKETGYTMLGVLLAYDVLSFGPPIYRASVSKHAKEPAAGAASPLETSTAALSDPSVRTSARRALFVRVVVLVGLGAAYIVARKALTVHFVVRNFRRVENPIAFQPNASLLLVPYQLSPDWSFNCVPLIEQATDPRNLLTVSLYLFLAVFSIVLLLRLAQPPSRVLLFYLALTVAPFIPAANIFFYVGTFIGERLLYIPSLGFCYLFTHLLVWLAHTAAKWYRRRTRSRRLLRPAELDAPLEVWAFVAALALLLSPCLAYYALRTLSHNTVWKNEESLFLHALQVCPTSAKVQENVGVLERRRRDWPKALNHFQLARAIDPDLCEIDHWMGLTHINAGNIDKALPFLHSGLGCIWCYANCFDVLQKVHEAMIEKDPVRWLPSWAGVCELAATHHPEDAAAIFENLAVIYYNRSDTLSALRALVKASERPAQAAARCRVLNSAVALCKEHASFPAAECAALIERSIECEPNATHAAGLRNGYMLWLHRALHADAASPELQLLWADLLTKVDRTPESAPHYQASIQLYMDKNRYWDAFTVAQRAVAVHPASCELRLLLGFLHAVHREYDRAREHLTRSTEGNCSEDTRNIARSKLTEVMALASV